MSTIFDRSKQQRDSKMCCHVLWRVSQQEPCILPNASKSSLHLSVSSENNAQHSSGDTSRWIVRFGSKISWKERWNHAETCWNHRDFEHWIWSLFPDVSRKLMKQQSADIVVSAAHLLQINAQVHWNILKPSKRILQWTWKWWYGFQQTLLGKSETEPLILSAWWSSACSTSAFCDSGQWTRPGIQRKLT